MEKDRTLFEKALGRTLYGHDAFYSLLIEMASLHSTKNADYAGDDPLANLRMCNRAGIQSWQGVVVRLSDKLSRLFTLSKKGTLHHESARDTFMDMAIYSLLGLILYRERDLEEGAIEEARANVAPK